jgi:hypothetical protein
VPVPPRQLSPATLLTQRLLWNRTKGKQPRLLPVVVLLGPSGSGKTYTLRRISRDCDAGVVHAKFDFDRTDPEREGAGLTTAEVLAQLAFELSRRWRARRKIMFRRFTLGMIAANTSLGNLTRDAARQEIDKKIDEFRRNRRVERMVDRFAVMAKAAKQADLIGGSLAATINAILPHLVPLIGRKPLAEAKRWHADIPEAEGASGIDALIALSQLAAIDPVTTTEWLTAAFLADVRESYLRMVKPDPRSPCTCDNPGRDKHWHNWVVLLDNIDHGIGDRFLNDIVAARRKHLRARSSDHDPLLIIATSGRWEGSWKAGWRAPWLNAASDDTGLRTIPSCHDATYGDWTHGTGTANLQFPFYPVILESLTAGETAQILEVARTSTACVLAQRATGGLPAAVCSLVEVVGHNTADTLPPGSRGVLAEPATSDASGEADPWRARLERTGLLRELAGRERIAVDALISAAPFATAPWLVSSMVAQPHVSRILTELRTALWVSTPEHKGGTDDYAELHPWIAHNLVRALACREPTGNLPSYAEAFTALLNDAETEKDPTRTAYCWMSLGQLGDVVAKFVPTFRTMAHRAWVEQLRLVTRAPDNAPLDVTSDERYQQLVLDANHDADREDGTITNVVTRLVAASWLDANPFAVREPQHRVTIAAAFEDLRRLSNRPDVQDLEWPLRQNG